jgi:peptidoglycan/LPS O-acetylase OafA/YrhL
MVLAYLSYELFEKRFLGLKRRFEIGRELAPHPSRLVAPGVLSGRAVGQSAKLGPTAARFNET